MDLKYGKPYIIFQVVFHCNIINVCPNRTMISEKATLGASTCAGQIEGVAKCQ